MSLARLYVIARIHAHTRVFVFTISSVILIATAAILVAPRPAVPWWSNSAAIRRGAYDFATGSCISCHALAGISNANAAIDLTHEGRRRSPAWLLHEIAHPTSQRPPTPPGQTRDLAAYLSSLH